MLNTLNPSTELQITGVHTVRGINYWSRLPVTKVDLRIGAFENAPSNELPDFIDNLISYLPGLVDHRCSVGETGGFIKRMREGTYIPHIMEHVALELQQIIGHDVNFGRARNTGNPGEYVVVYEYLHEGIGTQVAYTSLEIIQDCITSSPKNINEYLIQLEDINLAPTPSTVLPKVLCCVLGSGDIEHARDLIANHELGGAIVSTSPTYMLNSGLPFSSCTVAVIFDHNINDIPPRFSNTINSAELLAIISDVIPEHGIIVCPNNADELIQRLSETDVHIKTFEPGASGTNSAISSNRDRTTNAVRTAVEAVNEAVLATAEAHKQRTAE